MADPVERIRTDVLVIGAGAAGLMAALEARRGSARVVLAAKGGAGRSGNSPMAEGGIQACFHLGDSPERHALDTLASGQGLSDPRLVAVLAERAPDCVRRLDALGVLFRREEDGSYFQYLSAGTTAPRGLWIRGGGPGLTRPLLRAVVQAGVERADDLMVTRLLRTPGGVGGACGVDLKTGAFVVLEAKAVVLATGGNESLYRLSDASLDATGDGAVLAWQAGAELVDMEFVQFFPHALVHPDSVRGTIVPEEVYFPEFGHGRLTDGAGAPFAHRYDPERKEFTTRDVLARGILAEVAAGRGSAHGGVLIDLRGCRREQLEDMIPALGRHLLANGVDIYAQPLEVAPSAHYQCGGIRIDERAATGVDGLFAAGECTGGIDGANRLGSNALTEAVVFGVLAGAEAARFASGRSLPALAAAEARLERDRLAQIRSRRREGSPDVLEVKRRLQDLMTGRVGLERTRDGLDEAIGVLEDLEADVLGRIAPGRRPLRFNLELLEYLELCNLVGNGLMVARAALAREESRGCHFRADHPAPDDWAWHRSLAVARDGGRMVVAEARSQEVAP